MHLVVAVFFPAFKNALSAGESLLVVKDRRNFANIGAIVRPLLVLLKTNELSAILRPEMVPAVLKMSIIVPLLSIAKFCFLFASAIAQNGSIARLVGFEPLQYHPSVSNRLYENGHTIAIANSIRISVCLLFYLHFRISFAVADFSLW